MTFKQKVYNQYHQLIDERINLLKQSIADLQESSKNETKSSAGDKYETTRAMLQLEQDKMHGQLNEAKQQKALFEQIDPSMFSSQIIKGSMVKTNKTHLFISIALGKVIVDSITVIALSPQSPLGGKLMGFKAGDYVEMNGEKYTIESVE